MRAPPEESTGQRLRALRGLPAAFLFMAACFGLVKFIRSGIPDQPTFAIDKSTVTSEPVGFRLDLPSGWSFVPTTSETAFRAQETKTNAVLSVTAGVTNKTDTADLSTENFQDMIRRDAPTVQLTDLFGEPRSECQLGSLRARCAEYTFKVQAIPMRARVALAQKGKFFRGGTYTMALWCITPESAAASCDKVMSSVVLPA